MSFKTIQLLRNNSVITSKGEHADVHAAALAKLNEILGASTTLDGQPVIVRYKDGTDPERTILGIKGTTANEIFDNVAGNDAIDTAIDNLIGNAGPGFDTLGEIQAKIEDMDLTAVGGGDGDVIITVSEADGKVSAEKASLSSIKLTGYAKTNDTGDIVATDTVKIALSKLENQIGQNSVSSEDKTVTIDTSGATTDLAVNIDNATLVKNGSNGTISANLEVVELDSTEIADLHDNNVKEAYKLIYHGDTNRTAMGGVVKIYKDSALQEVYLGSDQDTIDTTTGVITKVPVTDPQSMNFAYQLAEGTYSLTKIDVSKFLTNSEFADGLQVSGAGVVSVKKDANSGQVRTAAGDAGLVDVVTVSSAGLKIDNIQAAINYATTNLTVSAEGDDYITAGVDASNNKKINVTADVQDLTANAGTRGTYTVTDAGAVSLANEVAPSISGVADSLVDGSDVASKVKIYVDAAVAAEAAARNAYIEGAVKALDSSVSANPEDADRYSVLTGVTEVDGKLTAKSEVLLAAVAKTGNAADVAIADSNDKFAATTVEDALNELASFDCGTYS